MMKIANDLIDIGVSFKKKRRFLNLLFFNKCVLVDIYILYKFMYNIDINISIQFLRW